MLEPAWGPGHNAGPRGPRTVTFSLALPYPPDSATLFSPLAGLPWAQWLDSAGSGRYDIITALPRTTLVCHGGETRIETADGYHETRRDDPFQLLRQHLGPPRLPVAAPFAGGALGYFAYDLARRRHALPSLTREVEAMPDMAVGIYDGALVVDHQERTCRLWASGDAAGRAWATRFQAALAGAAANTAFALTGAIESSPDRAAYGMAFARVKDYIRAGDCYQVNLAMRFAAPCRGHPWPLYQALRERNPAPFSAWLNFPFGQVLSTSPERFLAVREGCVETRPIKGTRPRSQDPGEDARRMAELSGSLKDRAENLMIVDLLRNDLGRVCEPGSVCVPCLFAVESFATVHHLVSTVRGRLPPGRTALDQLAAAFPGGSITGAPKLRAMQIIEELEAERRGVYCGSIGYLGFDGGMDSNIAIRTLTCADGQVRFLAGGGVVADSSEAAEYRECLDKARALLEVLGAFHGK